MNNKVIEIIASAVAFFFGKPEAISQAHPNRT
jgi:hypothetical protein